MTSTLRAIIFCLLSLPLALFAQSIPPLNSNAWNFVFVQSFEEDSVVANNLSVQGLNHSFLFGQLLNTVTAGKIGHVRQIYTMNPQSGSGQSMATLQSIEPYALLNNLSITHLLVSQGDRTVYNSPAYIISNILSNQPQGHYIIAMPVAMINNTIEALTSPTSSPAKITPGNYNQYAVLTVENGNTTVTTYDDNLKPGRSYPDIRLAKTPHYQCPQTPVTITAKKPQSSTMPLNTNQTVYFIRHVEAHPTSTFENGNYVCQGAWRALGANKILRDKMNGIPEYILSTNPENLIACDKACSYIRPSLTISPFAIENHKNVELAAFQWNDAPTLASTIFTQGSPYSSKKFNHSTMLVAWEHVHIEAAIQYLFATIYDNPEAAKKVPSWSYTDYDTIWKLSTDAKGNVTFSNTCEGVDTNALPSTCPAFPVETRLQ